MATILLVDDDALLRELIGMALSGEGFDVEEAENGADAFCRVGEHRYDLVIADLMMPVMDGLSFLNALRDKVANPPPVIVLSAARIGSSENDILGAGATEVIRKPVEVSAIVDSIRDRLAAS